MLFCGSPYHNYLSYAISQGYSNEITGPYLELHYNYAVEKLDMGTGFSYVSDVYS